MAYCKIHAIRDSVRGAINYITAPNKTDGKCLVTAFDCSPETAAEEFAFELAKSVEKNKDANKAYHLIQSFCPGEVTPDIAHSIGVKLADELLGGKYAYVVATHIDREHVHNHIVFCSVNNETHYRFHSCGQSYRTIRNISDRLCKERGLTVIEQRQYKSKSYKEWKEEKIGNSWKSQVRKDINSAIKNAIDYDNFIRLLREQGYQIKGENIESPSPKYISFLPPGMDRWIRGRATTLGEDFTRERIYERINEKSQNKADQWLNEQSTNIITISEETLHDKPYLKRWADRKNLQIATDIYTQIKRAGYSSLDDALNQLSDSKECSKKSYESASDLDKKMRSLSDIIRYAEQYNDNLPYKRRYLKSKDPDSYFQRHESEISLCDGAAYMLKNEGLDPDRIDLESLKSDYANMRNQKNVFMNEYSTLSSKVKDLEKLTEQLERYLERNDRNRTTPEKKKTLS